MVRSSRVQGSKRTIRPDPRLIQDALGIESDRKARFRELRVDHGLIGTLAFSYIGRGS